MAAGATEDGDGEECDEPDCRDDQRKHDEGGDEERAASDKSVCEDLEDGLDETDQDADDRQRRLRNGEDGVLDASLA